MQENIPYSTLKQDERSYEIMLLRDQHDNSYADIAKEYGITTSRVVQIYTRTKRRQIRLYIDHIEEALGDIGIPQVEMVYEDAYKWYHDLTYAAAYLEKEYKTILDEYRAGEPGMPQQFIADMPPFRPELNEQEINQVVEMREVRKTSFREIANMMQMTQAKAKHVYEWFYHKQVIALIEDLQNGVNSHNERAAIWEHYFSKYRTSKERYDALTKG